MSQTTSAGAPAHPWRVALAGLIGTTIEWYDFVIYALAALSTFAIGVVARPVGGALIGHFGDRVGCKGLEDGLRRTGGAV
jgi:hypothetical protein